MALLHEHNKNAAKMLPAAHYKLLAFAAVAESECRADNSNTTYEP